MLSTRANIAPERVFFGFVYCLLSLLTTVGFLAEEEGTDCLIKQLCMQIIVFIYLTWSWQSWPTAFTLSSICRYTEFNYFLIDLKLCLQGDWDCSTCGRTYRAWEDCRSCAKTSIQRNGSNLFDPDDKAAVSTLLSALNRSIGNSSQVI